MKINQKKFEGGGGGGQVERGVSDQGLGGVAKFGVGE